MKTFENGSGLGSPVVNTSLNVNLNDITKQIKEKNKRETISTSVKTIMGQTLLT